MNTGLEHLSWAIPTAAAAYRNRAEIQSMWNALWGKIFGKKLHVAFTGMMGVGKTVLLDHLSGKAFKKGYTLPPPSCAAEEGFLALDAKKMMVTVVPGDISKPYHDTMDKLFPGKKPIDGVVHVVANGFASIRLPSARDNLVKLGLKSIKKFTQHQRNEEVQNLGLVCEAIKKSLRVHRKPTWLFVAATKADLYCDGMQEVESRYSPHGTGDFQTRINQFLDSVGRDNFRWGSLPVCSWLESFEWNGRTIKSKLSPQQRDWFLDQMGQALENFCGQD